MNISKLLLALAFFSSTISQAQFKEILAIVTKQGATTGERVIFYTKNNQGIKSTILTLDTKVGDDLIGTFKQIEHGGIAETAKLIEINYYGSLFKLENGIFKTTIKDSKQLDAIKALAGRLPNRFFEVHDGVRSIIPISPKMGAFIQNPIIGAYELIPIGISKNELTSLSARFASHPEAEHMYLLVNNQAIKITDYGISKTGQIIPKVVPEAPKPVITDPNIKLIGSAKARDGKIYDFYQTSSGKIQVHRGGSKDILHSVSDFNHLSDDLQDALIEAGKSGS